MSKDKVLLDIAVADGKYRIVQWRDQGVRAFRHMEGVPVRDLDPADAWLDVTNTPGSNMIVALAYELEQAREETDGG